MARKSRYKTGVHHSDKCIGKFFKYRSGYELSVATIFDLDSEVKFYAYEAVGIPYKSNQKTGKTRRYFPDFSVQYMDGTKKIIEVKRDDKVNSKNVLKKAQACKEWLASSNIGYEIWTSKEIIKEQIRLNLPVMKPVYIRKKKPALSKKK